MNELWRYRWLKSSQSSKQNSRRSNRSSICNNSPTRVQRKCVPGKFVSCRIEDTLEIQRVYVCVRVQRMVDEKVDVCVCVCARVCVCNACRDTNIHWEIYIYIRYTYIVVLWRVGSGVGTWLCNFELRRRFAPYPRAERMHIRPETLWRKLADFDATGIQELFSWIARW